MITQPNGQSVTSYLKLSHIISIHAAACMGRQYARDALLLPEQKKELNIHRDLIRCTYKSSLVLITNIFRVLMVPYGCASLRKPVHSHT